MIHENPMEPPNGITVIPQTGQWVVTGDSHLGAWALQQGTIITDPGVFEFLKPHLESVGMGSKPNFTIYDLGANVGDHTRQYLDWNCQVVAVEPSPLVFACLTHNCPSAICINAAASDKAGEPLRFLRMENVGASRIHPDGDILVYPVVLDAENLPAPDFVKADIEGWELHALRGMERTIREHKPLIFMEVNHGALAANGVKPDNIVAWLAELGYATHAIYPPDARWSDPQFDVLFVPLV